MKLLLLCLAISGCYALESHDYYYDSRHNMVEFDSVVYRGKLIYRVFKCQNNCGYFDTFPNPKVDESIKAFQKAMLTSDSNFYSQYHR